MAARPGKSFPKKSYEALADFRYALRQFLSFSEGAAAEAGLTPQQYQALLALKGARETHLGVGDIAARLLIRHHTAVELVNRLEQSGFVVRSKDPADARRVFVMPTAMADRVMDSLAAAHLRELKGIKPVLDQLMSRFTTQSSKRRK